MLLAPSGKSRFNHVDQSAPPGNRSAAVTQKLVPQPGAFFDENGSLLADRANADHGTSEGGLRDSASAADKLRNHGVIDPTSRSISNSAERLFTATRTLSARCVASRYARPHRWHGSR